MHFLRLIRPINLLIIAFTMYSTRLFLHVFERIFNTEIFKKNGEELDFFLLVFSTILIGAAGNIINDYFDIKADRINKPEKLIITKYINRRWAIFSHWVLNSIAFGIAIYLSARNNTFWYMFIHLLSINLLWFYSMHFKRRPFIGNFIIASLTALVPILCGVHFYVQNEFSSVGVQEINTPLSYWVFHLINNGHFILLLAFFAFSSNFSREIIKDIEDMEGDKMIHAKTIPILYGIKKSKLIASITLLISPLFFVILFLLKLSDSNSFLENLSLFVPVLITLFLEIISIYLLTKATSKKQLKTIDSTIKLAMLTGLLLPFYWIFLL